MAAEAEAAKRAEIAGTLLADNPELSRPVDSRTTLCSTVSGAAANAASCSAPRSGWGSWIRENVCSWCMDRADDATNALNRTLAPDPSPVVTIVADTPPPRLDAGDDSCSGDCSAPIAPDVVPPRVVDSPPVVPDPTAPQPAAGPRAAAPSGGPTGGTGDKAPAEKKAADKGNGGGLPGMPTAMSDQAKPKPPDPVAPHIPMEERRPEAPPTVATVRSTGGTAEPSPDVAPPTTSLASVVSNGLKNLLALLPSSKTSSAIDASPGSAGFGVQAGTDGGKNPKGKDRARIAKKEIEAEVNNGFVGGPAGRGAGANKDKTGKAVPGKDKPRNGGLQMAGTVEEGISGPNWSSILKNIRGRIHPSQRDRRIAAAGGSKHRELAASMSSLFGNMNRAYADEGSTLHIGSPITNYYTAAHVASVVGGEFRSTAQPRQSSPIQAQRPAAKSAAKIAGVSSRRYASTASLPAAGSQKAAPAKVFRPLNPKKTKVH